MNKSNSAIDEYRIKIVKFVLFIISASVGCSFGLFTLLKLIGVFPTISGVALGIFSCICVVEIIIMFRLSKITVVNNQLNEKNYRKTKIFILAFLPCNLAYLLFMVPSSEFWIMVFYFIIVMVFFLDIKMLIIETITCMLGVLALFLIKPEQVFISENFVGELIMRLTYIFFISFGLIMIVYFCGKILVNAKKDELEKNDNMFRQIVIKTTSLVKDLKGVSYSLEENVKTESDSMDKIAKASMSISTASNASMNNLESIQSNSENISRKMESTSELSSNLVNISTANEAALNNVLVISDKLKESNADTLKVVQGLIESTEEINKILALINQVAESTNLLAINASIEAARAGAAGRGFSVVATEVKTLANSTKNSLNVANKVIEDFKNNTGRVEKLMQLNTEQILSQNSVLINTVGEIKSTISGLKESANEVKAADSLCRAQNAAINGTAENMKEEIEQFGTIAVSVQENKVALNTIVENVEKLNLYVSDLHSLLENQ